MTGPVAVIDRLGTDGMLSPQCLAALLLRSGVEQTQDQLMIRSMTQDSWIYQLIHTWILATPSMMTRQIITSRAYS